MNEQKTNKATSYHQQEKKARKHQKKSSSKYKINKIHDTFKISIQRFHNSFQRQFEYNTQKKPTFLK